MNRGSDEGWKGVRELNTPSMRPRFMNRGSAAEEGGERFEKKVLQ